MTKKSLACGIYICFNGKMIVLPPVHSVLQNQVSTSSLVRLYTKKPLANSVTHTIVIPEVPFYSQFKDISSLVWQKVGCGAASLAMIIEYYRPDTVSVDTLLKQGVTSGAYTTSAGWSHQGLISLSKKYGLRGNAYDLSTKNQTAAFSQLKDYVHDGPVIASVHYKFDPKSTIPHLVVINGIKDGIIYYNDPAAKTGEGKIPEADFIKSWKKRFIVVRPVTPDSAV